MNPSIQPENYTLILQNYKKLQHPIQPYSNPLSILNHYIRFCGLIWSNPYTYLSSYSNTLLSDYFQMSLIPYRDLCYLKYATKIQAKFTPKQITLLKQYLSTQIVKSSNYNPFLQTLIPSLTLEQIPQTILMMAKQMEENNFRSFNINYFLAFITIHGKIIVQGLQERLFHCQCFCVSIVKYFQEFAKAKELGSRLAGVNLTPMVDILTQLLEIHKVKRSIKITKQEEKDRNDQIHSIFLALIFTASAKYVKDIDDKELSSDKFLQKAILTANLLVEQAQNQSEFEVVRDYLTIISHLLIFNGGTLRPSNILSFCFEGRLGVEAGYHLQKISEGAQKQYRNCLFNFSKLDPQYQVNLLKMIKNLLTINISNHMLITHFEILLDLIKQKIFPQLKKQVYDSLVQAQSKRNVSTIDKIFLHSLSSNIDLLDEDIQRYHLILAENGQMKRKQQFSLVYYYHYSIAPQKIQSQTVNLIFETYLEQNLPLQKIQLFITRQANIITSENIRKLHICIYQKNINIHLSLLSIILEKRREKGFKISNKNHSYQFFYQQWLIHSGNNIEIYKIYLKIITECLVGKSLEINPALINLSSCTIKIQGEHLNRGLQYYNILLKMAQKMNIFEESIFRYMILLHALFGDQLSSSKYSYFASNFSKIVHPQSTFLMYLQYLVTLLKNKASVLLYLQSVLQFQMNLNDLFYDKKLYDISFLARLIQQSQYFRICTYSIQSVTVIYELSLFVKNIQFYNDYKTIMKYWSPFITRTQAKSLTYFFAFRQIKKIYPFMRQRQLKNPSDRLQNLWNLIIFLLQQDEQTIDYLTTSPNKLMVCWKGQENIKRGTQIELTYLRNNNLDFMWSAEIVTNSKEYIIWLNNDRLIAEVKLKNIQKKYIVDKEIIRQVTIKQLKKRPESIVFVLRIQFVGKKKTFHLVICGNEVFQIQLDGIFEHMSVMHRNNGIYKDIKALDIVSCHELKEFNQHMHKLGRWEYRINSLTRKRAKSFRLKFDFDHAYCLIGEMLRHFSHINVSFAYSIFIRLASVLINKNIKNCIPTMVQVFSLLENTYSSLRGRNKQLLPQIQLNKAFQYSKELYMLYTFALLPLTYWQKFSPQSRQKVTNCLNQLFLNQQFKILQNDRLFLFDKCLQISCDSQYFFEKTCENSILNHTLNQKLIIKFKKLMILSKQSSIFQKYTSNLLQKLLQYLNSQNPTFQQQRARCELLISDCDSIRQMFSLSKIDSKIKLLHYLSQKSSTQIKGLSSNLSFVRDLTQLMNQEQRDELIPWVIIQVQQFIFRKKSKKIITQNTRNNRQGYLYLELMLLNRNSGSQQQKKDMKTLFLQLLKLLKIENRQDSSKIQLQSFFHSNVYLEFLIQIIKYALQKYQNFQHLDQSDIHVEVLKNSFEIISNFQKKNFLEFIIKYRYKCSTDSQLLKAIIQHEQFRNLKLSHLSIFLQYLFEVLILIQQKSKFSFKECEALIFCITEYMEYLFSPIDEKIKASKQLFYTFPRLVGHKQGLLDRNRILRRLKRVSTSIKFSQMRGGTYFKCILIILKLMRFNPNTNYSNIIEHLLFGAKSKGQKTNKSIFSGKNNIIGDLNPSISRQRTEAQTYISDVLEFHKSYYNKQDTPYTKQTDDIDLTAYLSDYFYMRLSEFIIDNITIIQPELARIYTKIFTRLGDNEKIFKQFQYSSPDNNFASNYEDIIKIVERQSKSLEDMLPISPVKTPTSPRGRSSSRPDFAQMEDIYSAKEIMMANITSPPKRMMRRKTEDISNQSRRRKEAFDLIKSDYRNWENYNSCKLIPTYFSQKAKQIKVIELIHTHFVIRNEQIAFSSISPSKLKEGQQLFIKKYKQLINLQKKQLMGNNQSLLQQKGRKVKKINPYTTPKDPVLSILQNFLPNMTCPITINVIKRQYDTRRFKTKQSLNMNYYLAYREDQTQFSNGIEESIIKYNDLNKSDGNPVQSEMVQIEQIEEADYHISKQRPFCQLITREGVYFCQFELEKNALVLMSKFQRPSTDKLWYLKLGTPYENLLKTQMKLVINPEDVYQIFYRKFNQITNNSLEFFMKNGTSKFISFYRRQNLSILIKSIEKVFKGIKIVKDVVKQFEDMKFSEKWIEGYLSNFDYIMLLNKYSGRTYNDLNQYFVFPWILKDYSSGYIDLANPDCYRDLSKPIGAINPDKLKRYREKYKNQILCSDRLNDCCLYGSHYSTSLFIFYYLVRLEPYSSLHRDMQKGSWDVADRLFNSVQQVWESLMSESATSDIKECIPEFYYLPAFLKNIANIELGQKQCGTDVGDVQLPPWASSSEEFVVTLRAALESDFVSETLHLWIDLIFGKHQNSEEKFNIFHPYSYSDPQVLNKVNSKNHSHLQGIVCQISYFGQCPLQLFKKQHKPKKTFYEPRSSSFNGRAQSSPFTVGSQVLLNQSWRVLKISSQNLEFTIQIDNNRGQKYLIATPASSSYQILKQNCQNPTPPKKNENKPANQVKIMINSCNQLFIGKEMLLDLDVNFDFQQFQYNQIWIACFGTQGLRVYNWQLELQWGWEHTEVKQVYLEATRMIFSIPSGKIVFFSFLDRKIQEITVFKEVSDMLLKVISMPRLPTKDNNLTTFKVLCVGDANKILITTILCQQSTNNTSLKRQSQT